MSQSSAFQHDAAASSAAYTACLCVRLSIGMIPKLLMLAVSLARHTLPIIHFAHDALSASRLHSESISNNLIYQKIASCDSYIIRALAAYLYNAVSRNILRTMGKLRTVEDDESPEAVAGEKMWMFNL